MPQFRFSTLGKHRRQPRPTAVRRVRQRRSFAVVGAVGGVRRGRPALASSEWKWFDTNISQVDVSNSGLVIPSFNLVAQDVTESSRVGRKMTVRHLSFIGEAVILSTTTAANTSDKLRMIIFLDKQCNGATATVADILELADDNSHFNVSNEGRFVILYEKFTNVWCPAGRDSGFGKMLKHLAWKKNVNIPIEFSGTDNNINKIRSNNIGCLMISSVQEVSFTGKFRIRYSDA